MVEGEDDDKRFRSWQTPSMRDGYESATTLYKRWSDCNETDDIDSFGKMTDSTPLINRDSNFYGFYDDLLKDDKPRTPFGHRN